MGTTQNAICCFEQILVAATHKTAAEWLITLQTNQDEQDMQGTNGELKTNS